MINLLKRIPLEGTLCCTELSDRRILVVGYEFIKVFSLDTYEELTDIPSEVDNWDSLVIQERSVVFVASTSGLYQYSLTDLSLVRVHEPTSYGYCLLYLKSKDRVLFNDSSNLLSLSLNSSTVTKLEKVHKSFITSIVSTSDERFVFTTGRDKALKQWSTDSWSVEKSVDITFGGVSLLVNEDAGIILVGKEDGSLAEHSLNDLSLIRTVEVHTDWIYKIVKLSSGHVMTCSRDASVCLPFKDNVPMKVSDKEIFSLTELGDKTIACCCRDGLRILSSPVQVPKLVAKAKVISSTLDPITSIPDSSSSGIDSIKASTSDKKPQLMSPPVQDPLIKNPKVISAATDSMTSTLNSISSSLDSIRSSSSGHRNQLISLLQHHLSQLLPSVQHQPEKSTGLALSLLPDLKSIYRSHLYDGSSGAKKRVLTQTYILEMISSNSSASDSLATLTLFDRKIKLLGKVTHVDNPTADFKVLQMSKEKWVFILDKEFGLSDPPKERPATAHFSNGYLNCLISEGVPLTHPEFKAILMVDKMSKTVSAIENDSMVLTNNREVYKLNFRTNKIEHSTKYQH